MFMHITERENKTPKLSGSQCSFVRSRVNHRASEIRDEHRVSTNIAHDVPECCSVDPSERVFAFGAHAVL
jgi:hypothetical protein